MGRNKYGESPRKQRVRKLGLALFILYVLVLIYLLFMSEIHDHVIGLHEEYHYNLVPFLEIRRFIRARKSLGFKAVFLNLFGNVLGFMPFGFFLPVITPRMNNPVRTIAAGAVVSACVEVTQLITRIGRFDVDDILLNTLGAALGYLLFTLLNAIRRKLYGESETV